MDISTEWDIDITSEHLREKAGYNPANTRMRKIYEETVVIGSRLAKPASIQGNRAIHRIDEGRVHLEGGLSFNSLHLSALLEGADHIVVMCGTIGPALEEAAVSLNAEGDILGAYLLDTYGSIAVNFLLQGMYERAMSEFPGLSATPTMSPGQLDWDVGEQDTLFELIDPRRIGVTLLPSSMMKPVKSATGVFGIGEPSRVRRGRLVCELCHRRDACAYRPSRRTGWLCSIPGPRLKPSFDDEPTS